ncbi:MAG: type II toxin-antitoxin system death-on-curing family toxin [Solirubrobacterales bacterium]|nr:type II toxin-antitoxin system death-on-curing family toxin [Solirubrobacterales bacterium]
MTVRYLTLDDYVEIARLVTGLDEATIRGSSRLELADSALKAPQAGFGETEFHPDFVEKAAVLVVRLSRNHPLPDGNKRAAFVALLMFIDINGRSWSPVPPVDEAEQSMVAIAAGDWAIAAATEWIRSHIKEPT